MIVLVGSTVSILTLTFDTENLGQEEIEEEEEEEEEMKKKVTASGSQRLRYEIKCVPLTFSVLGVSEVEMWQGEAVSRGL
ncbi:hypothetical protein E2C01_053066 [Portunus trituberculatus]|uniref:Uncharacterized protein n=1 Tax=Portunus trituberculatus TaxID=210409 RepID=A0A5B7GG44_PORTR|nr:hypothetical protein [Portunus trituberculatus]